MVAASTEHPSKLFIFALFLGMLATGTTNSLTKKFQFESCGKSIKHHTSVDASGKANCPKGEEKFSKPWSQNLIMFFGESVVLILLCRKKKPEILGDLDAGAPSSVPRETPFWIFAIPAGCDVLGTGIGGIGLLFISASVWQMMRGSIIVFTSILSVTFLKRRFYLYHWFAVMVTVTGITMVGFAAILDEGGLNAGGGTGGSTLKGLALVILSQCFSAFQAVFEEFYVKQYKATPAKVIGSEGAWGIIFMIVLLTIFYCLPGDDNDSFESFPDTVYKITQSPSPLGCWCLIYTFSISTYNYCGVTMAGKLSAVQRMLVDAMRTVTVWIIELAIFYATIESYCSPQGQREGECFGSPLGNWAYLQLAGFLLIIGGTLLYNGIVKLPIFFHYPLAQKREKPPMDGFMTNFASPIRMLLSPKGWLTSPRQSPQSPELQEALVCLDNDESL
eukprot:TRINITY_DN33566_c0_g1_i1.p1 TRINITY_DN33566_c0_g1~~TRINITY_DN33566_c0_g1_i1.p1  ORF type:complete len:467 (-),score=46.60 TRINITY_DN33566_c0_g1_i1:184-1524(-)